MKVRKNYGGEKARAGYMRGRSVNLVKYARQRVWRRLQERKGVLDYMSGRILQKFALLRMFAQVDTSKHGFKGDYSLMIISFIIGIRY